MRLTLTWILAGGTQLSACPRRPVCPSWQVGPTPISILQIAASIHLKMRIAAASGDRVSMAKTLSDMAIQEFFSFDDDDDLDHGETGIFIDDDEEETSCSVAESKAFWEEQHQLLQDVLSRSSSIESRIRRETEEAMMRMRSIGSVCDCSKECRHNCVLRSIVESLREAGYNSALCKSKWRRSSDIPSGEHSYIDVMVDPKCVKKGATRVVVELSLKSEFEMGRASDRYNSLVNRLPEVFVGRSERLRNVIKIMCSAAKKSMKEKKMHMAPWRKDKYMQSKWLGTCERTLPSLVFPVAVNVITHRPAGPRASMLTFDLHCPAVEVL